MAGINLCHKCVTKVEKVVFLALSVDGGEGFFCVKMSIKKAPRPVKSKALFVIMRARIYTLHNYSGIGSFKHRGSLSDMSH